MFSTSKKVLVVAATVMSMGSLVQADGGAAYAAGGCGGCHGATGKSAISMYPHLSGQNAAYTVKQLKDFQSGARKDPTMNAMAAMVVGKEQAIADWLAKQ
ncbi:Cytochrome c4 [Bathymodiolus heckerae thiotrophic gill symbiont]|uniref:c-type cytochrome n=1 Tax=Bathymodiolus heckerae thiotrophic gill symbiont TaxID=1052212 RepID=UPI0010B25108|nr:c-type cytochrome [Bathymodiolus heckerae thiotrophic gill symbiont]CAC9459440.1 Cytochrome c4 [uncultured Gammaproteobacteria bacterium]SMN12627.1 Cytochrome c4 [Bathymodiolus heckerae thiotrophic gill symbiont]SMN14222.1 Cytochrome c4 [uncultured Candidatus Thioglobus sp.]